MTLGLTTNTLDFVLASTSRCDELEFLESLFGKKFLVYNSEGECVMPREEIPLADAGWMQELLRAVARQGRPEIIAEGDVVALFAIPLRDASEEPLVAVSPFVTRDDYAGIWSDAERVLGCSVEEAQRWLEVQPLWPMHVLQRMGREAHARLRERRQQKRLEIDLENVSNRLASCYEEISLLHNISQNFRISTSDEELGHQVLELVTSCIPAESMCLVYLPVGNSAELTYKARTEPLLLTQGACPITAAEQVFMLVDQLGITHGCRPVVVNQRPAELDAVLPSGVEQFIVAPLVEDTHVFGYLLAFNHEQQRHFGTVESNLLASVGAMIGIHCANRDLYREQAELLASVVRALTSAIDAKDPYTCGHSDRVARVATRLAQELGCDKEFLSTIYMAGLLHDIGKIGIEDSVLRKPGALTDAEYEHIKQHPRLGHKILADIKQLSHVLPAVLHHHEQWDGRGYPSKLAGEQIPFIARILAVADAYDAMTSDRPYRPGMDEDRVAKIFTDGAGKQWDADVIRAFFAAHSDIVTIVDNERAELSLDVQQWL